MIGFDLDGVVCDLESEVRRRILDRCGYDIHESDHRTFEIQVPGWKSSQVWEVINGVISDCSAKPFPGVQTVLKDIYFLTGQPIFFLTARTDRDATLKWLHRNIDTPFDAHLVASSKDKWRFIPQHIRYFVEDRLSTANDLAERGIGMFLVNRHWNIGRGTHPDVHRVNDLGEVLEAVKPILEGETIRCQCRKALNA